MNHSLSTDDGSSLIASGTSASVAPSVRGAWLAKLAGAALLVAAIGEAYFPALSAPFVFDDSAGVVNNVSIRQLWPLWDAERPSPLRPAPDLPTSARPLVNLSLALNYAAGELDPRGYHLVNIVLHALAALVLWAVVAGALRLPAFAGRFEASASLLGYCVALLWALHPLQTESVAYVTQRTELMMGLCYLASACAALRYWMARSRRARAAWLAAAGIVCLAGMFCKEMMASAPAVILLFERTFLRGTFRRALAASWPLYLVLGACWVPLGLAVLLGERTPSAGFGLEVAASTWWFTQCKVLWLYLKLCFWPWPLVIHYEFPYLTTWREAWPWVAATGTFAAIMFALAWRRNGIGFLGVWLLAALSPTLVVPLVTEVAAERRMYVPLAAAAVLVVGGSYLAVAWLARMTSRPRAAGWLVALLMVAIASGLGLVTTRRLAAYQRETLLWQDAASHQPDSYVVQFNLGTCLAGEGQLLEAIEHFRRAAELKPDSAQAQFNWARTLEALQLPREAAERYEEAIRLKPDFAFAHNNLGILLANSGRLQAAIDHYEAALEVDPDFAPAHTNLAAALASLGRASEAIGHLQRAAELTPNVTTLSNLAYGYALVHRSADAIDMARRAIDLARQQGQTAAAEEIAGWLKNYRLQLPAR